MRDGEGVARKDHEHHAQAEHRPAQVVEYFPSTDGVHLVLYALATLVAHMGREPGDDLPVAARPAMVALGVVDVVGWVVVKDLHVVDEAAAYVAALQQVVAEDEVLREGPFEHLLEHAQVVDALAAEGALVEYVLIELEAGGGVDVQSAQSGHQLRVAALVGDLDVDVDAGLHDAVAAVHAFAVFRQLRHVERVRHRPDELLCRVEHQLRVGVEGNDEAYRSGAFRSPLADGLGAEAVLLLLPGGLAEEQVVEVEDGATLALVAEPGLLALAPGTAAVDEVEYRGTVFLVEFAHHPQAGFGDFLVPRGVGLLVRGGVADQRVIDVVMGSWVTEWLSG